MAAADSRWAAWCYSSQAFARAREAALLTAAHEDTRQLQQLDHDAIPALVKLMCSSFPLCMEAAAETDLSALPLSHVLAALNSGLGTQSAARGRPSGSSSPEWLTCPRTAGAVWVAAVKALGAVLRNSEQARRVLQDGAGSGASTMQCMVMPRLLAALAHVNPTVQEAACSCLLRSVPC